MTAQKKTTTAKKPTTQLSKQNATESSSGNVENEIPETSQVEDQTGEKEPKTSTVDMSNEVDKLIQLVRGYAPKFNREQQLSVVNLGDPVGDGQGIRFRQLFVEESTGYMTVSIKEGFKSNHGGQIQRKTLNSFRVPISDPESYARLQARFFGFNDATNKEEADVLLTTLGQSVPHS